MRTWFDNLCSLARGPLKIGAGMAFLSMLACVSARAQEVQEAGGEANLKLPDLSQVSFLGIDGHKILMFGLIFCVFGLIFGLAIYSRLKNLPVHKSMRDISELIYETCKTYLITQGKFILLLEIFIAIVIVLYFGVLLKFEAMRVGIILLFSLVGIAGSYGVAWFGIRVNTFANSRTAFASLAWQAVSHLSHAAAGGHEHRHDADQRGAADHAVYFAVYSGDYAGPCFIGFAIGESLGAAALRIAGGIFTKIADIGSDLMKIVFKIKEDDARNPGVIADCTGDNAGDSVGPSADGFETYGVTGVALITFILLGVSSPTVQVQLLVWIFIMRIVMLIASAAAYFINGAIAKARFGNVNEMNYEAPLTSLVWITSVVSIGFTYLVSYLIIPSLGQDTTQWWKLATIISCGTLAGAIIPELVKVFTSTESRHVREVVSSAQEGGASLGILSGFVAGNFSAYYIGLAMVVLMSLGYLISEMGLATFMIAAPVFAFGLVAFGFLGMGPVTIAVDSYGPVTDNAQSVYELSLIEQIPGIQQELKRDYNIDVNFERAKEMLEANDGAGNTFKATAKPVLIGTAVVGATTMIFSIIMALTHGLTMNVNKLIAVARAVRSRADYRRGDDLLVYGSVHAGGYHRRLPRRGIHQGQHPSGRSQGREYCRQQKSGGDLHQVCATRHAKYFYRGVFCDAFVCVRGAVLLYRLSLQHRNFWLVSSDFYGQCRRGLG